MNRIKRTMVVLTAAVLLTSMSVPCLATDNAFKEIFEDAFYGGLAGTLIGGALIAFTHKPADHLDRLIDQEYRECRDEEDGQREGGGAERLVHE